MNTFIEKLRHYIPENLTNAIFCGQIPTDLSAVAGVIAAAEYFHGIPAIPSPLNFETIFALQYWNVKEPERIELLLERARNDNSKPTICLINHQQVSQMSPCIDQSQIIGVIDTHGLQESTLITEIPIYIDVKPWGSVCSVLAYYFYISERKISAGCAGLLASGILLDTVKLKSSTSCEWDEKMLAYLVNQLEKIEEEALMDSTLQEEERSDKEEKIFFSLHLNVYYEKLLEARSEGLRSLSLRDLLKLDEKIFTISSNKIAISIVEMIEEDVKKVKEKEQELLLLLDQEKQESNLDFIFFCLINVNTFTSTVYFAEGKERKFMEDSYSTIESYSKRPSSPLFNNSTLSPSSSPQTSLDSFSTSPSHKVPYILSHNNRSVEFSFIMNRKKLFIPLFYSYFHQEQERIKLEEEEKRKKEEEETLENEILRKRAEAEALI